MKNEILFQKSPDEIAKNITRELVDLPFLDKYLKNQRPILRAITGFVFFIIFFASVFGFNTNIGLLEAADNFTWYNSLLSILFALISIYFIGTAAMIPLDIFDRIDKYSYEKIVDVAQYNPKVAQYLKDNELVSVRQYYYLNINRQQIVIEKHIGINLLKWSLCSESKAGTLSEKANSEIKNIRIKQFKTFKEVSSNSKIFFKFSIIGFVAILGFPFVFWEMGHQVPLWYLFVFSLSILCVIAAWGAKDADTECEDEVFDLRDYKNLALVSEYNKETHAYIAQVLEEGREFNLRDLQSLNVLKQAQIIEVDLIKTQSRNDFSDLKLL